MDYWPLSHRIWRWTNDHIATASGGGLLTTQLATVSGGGLWPLRNSVPVGQKVCQKIEPQLELLHYYIQTSSWSVKKCARKWSQVLLSIDPVPPPPPSTPSQPLHTPPLPQRRSRSVNKMVKVNKVYLYDRYERIWLKILPVIFDIEVFATHDKWPASQTNNTSGNIAPYREFPTRMVYVNYISL